MSLSYEFYYLLRTEVELDNRSQPEPYNFSRAEKPQLSREGFAIDEDKRLFRSETFFAPTASTVLPNEWLQQLQHSWQKIQHHYQAEFAQQGLTTDEAEAFCPQALLGVALLIADAQLDSLKVTMPLQDTGDRTVNQMIFKPSRWQLQVEQQASAAEPVARMAAPARFIRFDAHYRTKPAITQHWQLQLEAATPQLVPMVITTHTPKPHFAPNPIFAVYGLAHGELPSDELWPQQLQDFLLGSSGGLLVRVLPRLLARQWQFTRMDLAAKRVRRHLREQSNHFDQAPLRCLSNRELSVGLQTMASLDADTTLLLSKLRQAIQTIDIQRHNLTRRLQEATQHNPQWTVIWQNQHEKPLRDSFKADKQKLLNHIVYIQQGELTYLEGIRRRWHLHFEGRQLAWSEWLGGLGSILAFLVAVGAASITTSNLTQTTDTASDSLLSPLVQLFEGLQTLPWVTDLMRLLNNPLVYWCLVLILLSPIAWHLLKALFRKIGCCCKRWQQKV